MTWLNLREDVRREFASYGAVTALDCFQSGLFVWSQDKREAVLRAALLERKRRYAKSKKGRATERTRRARIRAARVRANLDPIVIPRVLAAFPLPRVMRWCPRCRGRHETTYSAEMWKRRYRQICSVTRKR